MNTRPRPVFRDNTCNGRSTGVRLVRGLAIGGVVGHNSVVLGDVEVDPPLDRRNGLQSVEMQPRVTNKREAMAKS
ncbi:MAG: hypothetical protein K0V04_09610 [Deltaproteobacteria bacterium]|nr:hypothetical protein [Deltaproteobacteria bacterium]